MINFSFFFFFIFLSMDLKEEDVPRDIEGWSFFSFVTGYLGEGARWPSEGDILF